MSDVPDSAPEFGQRIFDQLMSLYIKPDVERRQSAGELQRPFPLKAAQIIFFPEGKAPAVLVNDEVKVNAKLKLKDGVAKNTGDPIYESEVGDLAGVEITDPKYQNCGHATLMRFGNTWHIAFDFRYNKQLSQLHLDRAREFLDAAAFSIEKSAWASAVDNMFSAAELCSKALLMSFHTQAFAKKTTHGAIHSRINHWGKLGNVKAEHVTAYNRLHSWRAEARYPKGVFTLPEHNVRECLAAIEDMHAFATERAV